MKLWSTTLKKSKPKLEEVILKALHSKSHFIVIYPENEEEDYRSCFRARTGEDVQALLQAVIFEVAASLQTDPLTVCQTLTSQIKSVLLPQSGDKIN